MHLPSVAAPECPNFTAGGNLSLLQKTGEVWPSGCCLLSDTREDKGRFLSWRHRPKGEPKKGTGKFLLSIRAKTTFTMRTLDTRTGCLEGMWIFCS